jgi:hypothetical protein
MEMPIRIMITLFVAIIVGVTVISFSREMIEKSKQDIDKSKPGILTSEDEEQKIIELGTLDTNQVYDLVVECYNRHHAKTLERQLCFVVIAQSAGSVSYPDVKTNAEQAITATVDVSTLVNTDYALKIYFDPFGDKEKIELSK